MDNIGNTNQISKGSHFEAYDNSYNNYKDSKDQLEKDKLKLKDENISLEELGVFEVEGEIFDNFDEENIPVIKNIYKRKKGSAEKLKTNQNTQNLLMSTMNNMNNMNNHNIQSNMNNYNNINSLYRGNNEWLLQSNDGDATKKELLQLALDKNLDIVSLQTGGNNLEEIFRSLTQAESH